MLKKGNQVYRMLHLSQAYDRTPFINFIIPFLFILCLEVDLHWGQLFIKQSIVFLQYK
jgi:hypothetical protein